MNLIKLILLISLIKSLTTSHINCSVEDTCFGEPNNCDPNTNCQTLFYFDEYGNLHLILRNFTDPQGYAAFAVDHHPDETIEYFICVPNQTQRLRAIAELGGVVLVTEENLGGGVEKLSNTSFQCTFNSHEFSERFREEQVFFVTKGTFDEVLVIYDGLELFNLYQDDDSEDYTDDEIPVTPTLHYLGLFAQRREMALSGGHHKTDKEETETLSKSPRNIRTRSAYRSQEEDMDDVELDEKKKSDHRMESDSRDDADQETVENQELHRQNSELESQEKFDNDYGNTVKNKKPKESSSEQSDEVSEEEEDEDGEDYDNDEEENSEESEEVMPNKHEPARHNKENNSDNEQTEPSIKAKRHVRYEELSKADGNHIEHQEPIKRDQENEEDYGDYGDYDNGAKHTTTTSSRVMTTIMLFLAAILI